MKELLVGMGLLVLAGGGSLKDLTATGQDPDVVSGRIIYQTTCVRCHGMEGKGDGYRLFSPPVADLTSPAVQRKLDARLFKSIHDGKSNSAMGAWREVLTDEEISDVLGYVRTMAQPE